MISNAIPPKSSLIGKILVLFVCVFVLQVVYVATVFVMVEQTRVQVVEQQSARRALSSIGRVMRSVQDLIICMGKGEIMGAVASKIEYNDRLIAMNRDLRALKLALADKPGYSEIIAEIENTCQTIPEVYEDLHKPTKGAAKNSGRGRKKWRRKHRGALQFNFDNKIMVMGKTDIEWLRVYMSASEVLTRLEAIQEDYRQTEREVQEHLRFQSSLLFNASLLMGFMATALGAFFLYNVFVSGIVVRLRTIGEALDEIAEGKALPEGVLLEAGNVSDEVGHLASELQSMQLALKNIRSKEKTLLDNAVDCICSIDEHGEFVKISPASSLLWGIAPEDLLGKSIMSIVETGDRDAIRSQLDELFHSGQPVTFESRVRKPDGRIVEFAWTASLAEERNLAVCVAHDITARNAAMRLIKQRDAEFRAMIDSMPIAVITCDQTSTISSINPATQDMLEYSPQELLGKKISLLLFGSTKSGVATSKQIEEFLAVAEKQSIELVVSKASGARLPVEFTSRVIELQDLPLRLATMKDVSARFEIETVKKEFVSMISHDLRSPLTAIHGTLEMLAYDNEKSAGSLSVEDEENAAAVSRAEKIVFSIVNVLNDFLDLEKFEAGLVSLELEEVSLSGLLNDVKEALFSCEAPLILTVDAEPEALTCVLNVDRARLLFALSTIALVANGCGARAPRLVVTRSGDEIHLAIDGCNIPESVERALDSPYVFLSEPELTALLPSGLSLSLSLAILQKHGGRATVDRTSGNGKISVVLSTRG